MARVLETARIEALLMLVLSPWLDTWEDSSIDAFRACMGGPGVQVTCCLDYDGDGDVDLRDFAVMQEEMG